MTHLIEELAAARRAANLSQQELADKAGLSRLTVQRTESAMIDPRLSSLHAMARALGMDLMLVPQGLRPELESFVRSGGRFLGQPAGIAAPRSVVDSLLDSPGS